MIIFDLYEQVKANQILCRQGYYACQISEGVYIASIDNEPALLICKNSIFNISESFSLKYLDIYSYSKCLLSLAGRQLNADLIVFKVNSSDQILINWFLSLLESFADSLLRINSSEEFHFLIDKFIGIFSKIDSPPKGTVIGLIGELLVINSSQDPDSLISSWHIDPTSRIDFIKKNIRIEVKATTRQQRTHRIKLGQLLPFDGLVIYIASVVIDLVNEGADLIDLNNLVSSRCKNVSSRIILSSMISETLGGDIRYVNGIKFDLESAMKSLSIYQNIDIPRPLISEIPAGISNISFDLDFSAVKQIDNDKKLSILG